MELPKINKRFEVFNKAEKNEAEMYLYGSIGSAWYADISSQDVRYKLNTITSKTIHIQ